MAKKTKLKQSEIQKILEESIKAQHEICIDKDEKGRSTNAANALSGLAKTYHSIIGFEPDLLSASEEQPKKGVIGRVGGDKGF